MSHQAAGARHRVCTATGTGAASLCHQAAVPVERHKRDGSCRVLHPGGRCVPCIVRSIQMQRLGACGVTRDMHAAACNLTHGSLHPDRCIPGANAACGNVGQAGALHAQHAHCLQSHAGGSGPHAHRCALSPVWHLRTSAAISSSALSAKYMWEVPCLRCSAPPAVWGHRSIPRRPTLRGIMMVHYAYR